MNQSTVESGVEPLVETIVGIDEFQHGQRAFEFAPHAVVDRDVFALSLIHI